MVSETIGLKENRRKAKKCNENIVKSDWKERVISPVEIIWIFYTKWTTFFTTI